MPDAENIDKEKHPHKCKKQTTPVLYIHIIH